MNQTRPAEADLPRWEADLLPIPVGISACLLGAPVRFDGGHKRDRFLTGELAPFVRWVPVCPEMGIGLGAPRASLRLERRGGDDRLICPKTGRDHTDEMRAWARDRAAALGRSGLAGFVLKKDSPSCGMTRVRVRHGGDRVERDGVGSFAAELMRQLPELPIEEEGRLCDPGLRASFVERLLGRRQLDRLFVTGWTLGELVRFHTGQKMTLLAHSPRLYRTLGRLVADARAKDREEVQAQYSRGFLEALATPVSGGRNVNVLQHLAGHLRGRIDAASRSALDETIDDYARGVTPLAAPASLLRAHARSLSLDWVADQHFLRAHPVTLSPRLREMAP